MIYKVKANEEMFYRFRKLEEELQIKHLLSTVVRNNHFLQQNEFDDFVKETRKIGRGLYGKRADAIIATFYHAVAELIEYIKGQSVEMRAEEEFHDFRTNMCEFYRPEPEHVCNSQMNPMEGANSCQMQHSPLLPKSKKEEDGVELIANKPGAEMPSITPAVEAVRERYEKELQDQLNSPELVTLGDIQKNADELCAKHGWNNTQDHRFRYLSEEFGEVAKAVNQIAIHGPTEELKEQLGSELFALIWNAAALANVYGINLEQAAAAKVLENESRAWPEPVEHKEPAQYQEPVECPKTVEHKQSLIDWAKQREGLLVQVMDEYRTNSVGDFTAEGPVENRNNYMGTLRVENGEVVIKSKSMTRPNLKIESNYTHLEILANRAALYWLNRESDGKYRVKVRFLRVMLFQKQ